jgi:hypothetical protein
MTPGPSFRVRSTTEECTDKVRDEELVSKDDLRAQQAK